MSGKNNRTYLPNFQIIAKTRSATRINKKKTFKQMKKYPNSPPLRRLPTYILKPSSGAMGRNIHLVQLPEHIPQDAALEGAVAQQYIDRPLLLDGRKFDCRVYVLVRTVWPLELHVYQVGSGSVCWWALTLSGAQALSELAVSSKSLLS